MSNSKNMSSTNNLSKTINNLSASSNSLSTNSLPSAPNSSIPGFSTNSLNTALTTPNNSKPNNNINNNNNNNNNGNGKKNAKNNGNMLTKGVGNISNTIKNKLLGTNENKKDTKSESKNESKNKGKNESKNQNKKKNTELDKTPEEEGSSKWYLIGKIVIMIIVLAIIFYVSKYLLQKYKSATLDSPYLLNGSKNAKHALVISQDPLSVNYIPINKSENRDGIQFTYGFWVLFEGFDYKKGEWKHIFHKGNSSSYPNRAPGVFIHPDKNSIRVIMNTLDNIIEFADIDNVPINKWLYINIILNNKNLDLYVNGYLKLRKQLSALPKQNDDDFWVNMFGGFEGYVSNIRYYSYAIDFNEMNNNIKQGPSINNCINTGEIPPYLDDNWWFDYNI